MLSGRENYIRAIEFKNPAYLPGTLSVDLDWLQEKDPGKKKRIQALQAQFRQDMLGGLDVQHHYLERSEVNGIAHWRDEWGTEWEDDGHGARAIVYPLASGYEALATYAFPDPAEPDRFNQADAILQKREDRYARACVWFTLFERLWMLRGFENMLIDPYVDYLNFCKLRDRLVEYKLAIIDQWIARGVDAIFFSDDWGSQNGLLMNPADWRKFYKPAYRTLFERIRSGGAHVWMHLCGNIIDILPDLIDVGLNVLNPVQPQAMNLNHLAREFGGKICFNGGVDVQGVLIQGRPSEVKDAFHRLVELFGRYKGGYIGGTSHSIMPETPLDNVIALFEVFGEYQQG